MSLLTFLFATLKLIINFELLKPALLRILFFVIGLQGKCARINFTESQAAPLSIFSVKIAALGSLKQVTARIFTIGK
jgi:hypothetical protein